MKYIKRLPILMLCCVLIAGLLSCGGRGKLEKAIRTTLVSGDTTRAAYDSLCTIVTENPGNYGDLLTPEGRVDHKKMADFIEQIGSQLRPPMHWDTRPYGGVEDLSLTVYFERSGSMVPYDQRGGGGQLKKAVNDLINHFPAGSKVDINIVNDGIYPYQHTVDEFLKDRDIYQSTEGIGNASYTDFQLIFEKILEAQRPGNVSVLVSDLIYSPKDTHGVSLDKIFNEENSLATRVFAKYKGKSVVVQQFMGDYSGKYYPYNNEPFNYNGKRPFYLVIIADNDAMDQLAQDKRYSGVLDAAGVRNSYRFNQGTSEVQCRVLPEWKDNAGRFRVKHGDGIVLTKCDGDRQTGKLCFSLAANLSGLMKDDALLTDAANYEVKSIDGYTLTIQPIDQSMVTANNKEYLEGMTHILTLVGDLKSPRDEVRISLLNELPVWVGQSSSDSDTSADGNFSTTTLGLEQLLGGMFDAMKGGSSFFDVTIQLQR
ncbi:MAG: hypothetical protein IKW85_04680 [Muribaculaceae bacterium]|nr:hypothetical protein [Muribaculaceae bacterium]